MKIYVYIQENVFENVLCKMAAILYWSQWVKDFCQKVSIWDMGAWVRDYTP